MAELGSIAVVEAPEDEPVTVAELREHCRIDHNEDNTYLSGLITAARVHVESRTGKLIGEQTVRQIHDSFPCGRILLQRTPITSVEITYIDTSGDEQTMDEDDIQTNLDSPVPIVAPAPETDWPSTQCGRIGAVTITCEGGFASCPKDLKQAILMLAAHWYTHREAVSATRMSEVPQTVDAILGIYASPLTF